MFASWAQLWSTQAAATLCDAEWLFTLHKLPAEEIFNF